MESVSLACGERNRYFNFGTTQTPQYFATASPANSLPTYKERVYTTFQAIVHGSGALTSTVLIQAANDDKTGKGIQLGVREATSTTLISPNLFNGYLDLLNNVWIPAVQIGDLVTGDGIPANTTVTAIASAGSLTLSNPTTLSGERIVQFQSFNYILLATLSPAGTNNGIDGATTTAAWRFVRASWTASTGTITQLQVLMGL